MSAIDFTDEQLAAVADAVEFMLEGYPGHPNRELGEALDILKSEANNRCRWSPQDITGNSLHVARLARVAR